MIHMPDTLASLRLQTWHPSTKERSLSCDEPGTPCPGRGSHRSSQYLCTVRMLA